MRTSIQFRSLEGLDHIRSYVENSVDQAVGKFESWRQFDTHVILGMAKTRSSTHKPVFECEVLVKGKGLQRTIFTKKTSADFYQAVRSSLKTVEKILRRASKIRVSDRRHPEFEIKNNQETVA
ncbi:MAG: HPF/RaiA family ribosome-associated protein [Bdellovibrionales bacterium]|jgi:ribosomal subunit interface protein|nr:HPF/RaiA family ribosome-associated protein [Bdellovibrionales bacterium]